MKKLEVELDKDIYFEGDNGIANITFVNTPDGWFGRVIEEVRSFSCDIYGYETTIITVKEKRPIQSTVENRPESTPPRDLHDSTPPRPLPTDPPFEIVSVDYREQNLFLHIDLDDKIQKLGEKMTNNNIKVKEGTQKIEIPFKLPDKLYEVYNGTHADIFYSIEVNADIPWKVDLNDKKDLQVKKKSSLQNTGKPIFIREGNNTIYTELTIDRDTFTPGDTISGRIDIKNIDNIPVRNIFLNLIGLEYAFANNKTLTRTTIVEQYDTTVDQSNLSNDSVNFHINIPVKTKREYQGKFSYLEWSIKCLIEKFSGSNLTLEGRIHIN